MPVTFSFGGAGQHFPFMMGVACALKTHFAIDWSQVHVHCISSGCSGAICLLTCTPDEIDRLVLRGIAAAQATHLRKRDGYYLNIMKSMMPADFYQTVGRRLVIGKTDLMGWKQELTAEHFETQAAALTEICSSCLIPFITGELKFKIDGGFSHQYAIADANTIVITLNKKQKGLLHSPKNLPILYASFLRSKEEMLAMYQNGKAVVADNLALIAAKIVAGQADGTTEVLFQGYML